jgi:hypothetical protein
MKMLVRVWSTALCLISSGCATETSPQEPAAAAWPDQVFDASIDPGTPGRTLPAPDRQEPTLRLAVLPDRTTGRDWGLAYLSRAMEDIRRSQLHAMIGVGDSVQGYTRSMDQYTAEVDEFFEIIEQGDTPFYPVCGNHDVISGSRRRGDDRFISEYQRRFGPLYYAVNFNLATAIMLNTDENLGDSAPTFGEKQLEWLDGALLAAAERDRPIIIFMHRPAWRYGASNFMDEVHPRLVAAGADAVIAGHFHALQYDGETDGIEYHIVGTCGGMIDQHPLAGQMQHLTFINITASGDVALHHRPVGHTLPYDWILAEDQERSFNLKRSRGIGRFTPLPQPTGRSVEGVTRLRVRNPIDRPVTFRAELVNATPGPRTVEGESFVSWTERDIFSPHNTHSATSFRQAAASEPITIEPGEDGELIVSLRAPAADGMVPPPEIHVIASFTDSRGRTVPVTLRRRVPLIGSVSLSAGTMAGPFLCWAWDASVYDTDEASPHFRLSRTANDIVITLQVPDDVVSYHEGDVDDATRIGNPMSDAVIVAINGERFLIEPFAPAPVVHQAMRMEDREWLVPAEGVEYEARRTPEGYGVAIVVRDLEFPMTFDVQVADNDDGYFTQWRYFAAPGAQPEGVPVE